MKKFTQKEQWLHLLLSCIYKEKGQDGIFEMQDIVEKYLPPKESAAGNEMQGQILDFIYATRENIALQKLEAMQKREVNNDTK